MTVKYIGFSRRSAPCGKWAKVLFAAIALMVVGCGDRHGAGPAPPDAAHAMETPGPNNANAAGGNVKPSEIPAPRGDRIGGGQGVTRAMAAKMIALALYGEKAISSMEREITFSDTDASQWYDKYINAVFIHGCMSGGGAAFQPNDPFTFEQVRVVLGRLDPEGAIKIKADGLDASKPVSYELWVDIYLKLLQAVQSDGIENKSFVVLASAGNHGGLGNYIISDIGPFRRAGLSLDDYIDRRVEALVRDGEIAALLSVSDWAPVIRNAYVVGAGDGLATIFSGGAERAYAYEGDLPAAAGEICDIRVENGRALEITVKKDRVGGAIRRASETLIEVGGREYKRAGDFKVYSTASGPVKWKNVKDLIVGAEMAIFVTDGGEACAGVITKPATAASIRVALRTSGYKGLIHEEVRLTANSPYTVTHSGGAKHFGAGETFEAGSIPDAGRVCVVPDSPDGEIEILSIKRDWPGGANPRYAGVVEIGAENGGYSVVNELPLEQYLYAVVPSEMPSSYGLEASKAQAVTARSYAYCQLLQNRFHDYGANVDDSVICQVYNNIPPNEISKQAVDETGGMVLRHGGNVISANFFSTSSGMTANSGEVWAADDGAFPSPGTPYLVSAREYTGKAYGDLAEEENAARFFKSMDVSGYDSDMPWFRWSVSMSAAELTASINMNLKQRYEAAPPLIKTMTDGGAFRSRPVESIGFLRDLEVTKRGQGGNIMEMKFTGTNASILVETEYNIRALLQPKKNTANGADIYTVRKDGSLSANFELMPSAFFVMEKSKQNGTLEKVSFYGGGYGHGVGMSQNGAKGMIEKGFNFSQVIAHYYPGTEIGQIDE